MDMQFVLTVLDDAKRSVENLIVDLKNNGYKQPKIQFEKLVEVNAAIKVINDFQEAVKHDLKPCLIWRNITRDDTCPLGFERICSNNPCILSIEEKGIKKELERMEI